MHRGAEPIAGSSAQRVRDRGEAERLVADVLATIRDLQTVLDEETAQLRAGRISAALARETRKTELSGSYLRGLEAVKANAIALARLAPDGLEALKAGHGAFRRALEINQTVLATARAVSESLVKSVAEEMDRTARPQGYGPAAAPGYRAPASGPLVVSRVL